MIRYLNFVWIILCFATCKTKDTIDIEDIYGDWYLVDWYNDEPIDINGDEKALVDLYSQWECCYKQSIFKLKKGENSEIIYIGEKDKKECREKVILWPAATYNKRNNSLDFVYKYYRNIFEIVALSESELIIQGALIPLYACFKKGFFYGGYMKFTKNKPLGTNT